MRTTRVPFLRGQKYGRLTIESRVPNKDRRFICLCECGNRKEVSGQNLRHPDPDKRVWSCGCIRLGRPPRLLHGHCIGGKPSPTRITWNGMKLRCLNPNTPSYRAYGARGITIDPRWHKFENFLEDMGIRPEGMTLDRIDTNKNYNKENCRWATRETQTANRRKHTSIPLSRLKELELMEAKLKELGITL